ncbi:SprT-like domain-containing protein [uncultured Chitinophaga sp.]|uniref:SprT-like domain-containing protein n=1 Tax=uncultured Chitinophaga sp. TaxID=339340 RepID=UPI0025D395FE|nr:SprT-like domain-containing protein [uncultured Chitinophaga sp.]
MKKEHPLSALATYLPEGTFEQVAAYLTDYKVHLTLTRERASVLGDYRHPYQGKGHRISVNGNLNKFAFLITLLHELAHLVTFNLYAHSVAAHGKEWKHEFAVILRQFLGRGYLPPDVETALRSSLHDLAASSCADENLMRVLRNYDRKKENHYLIEQLTLHQLFRTKDGRIFRRGEKVRKRFKCEEVATKKMYLFSPVYEVEIPSETA